MPSKKTIKHSIIVAQHNIIETQHSIIEAQHNIIETQLSIIETYDVPPHCKTNTFLNKNLVPQ